MHHLQLLILTAPIVRLGRAASTSTVSPLAGCTHRIECHGQLSPQLNAVAISGLGQLSLEDYCFLIGASCGAVEGR
jgi:hypothetical protein